jgi:hypothetical protein
MVVFTIINASRGNCYDTQFIMPLEPAVAA